MAAEELDPEFDPALARRLAALHPDVSDDGFTATLVARLPARAPARPARPVATTPSPWPLGLAAAFALTLLALLLHGSGPAAVDGDFLAGLDAAADRTRDLGGLLERLPALFETHLHAFVAAALCAATLVAPQLLED